MNKKDFKGKTIAFIGAGNMAEAILKGILSASLADPGQVIASDPAGERRAIFADCGCRVCNDNREAVAGAAIIILAVKPQVIEEVVKGFAEKVSPEALVVSIAAGISCRKLEKLLPENTHLVRVMPNTPMLVGCGVSGLAPGACATKEDMACAAQIFSSAGVALQFDNEEKLHAVTALSGSGPAYVFYFIEALVTGGIEAGLPAEVAKSLASGTVLGAVTLLMESGEEAGRLRQKVTSPGGTTAAALEVLGQGKFTELVSRAILAAKQRSIELGGCE